MAAPKPGTASGRSRRRRSPVSTWPPGRSATAAEVQSALQSLLFPTTSCGSAGRSTCAQSVLVWQAGGDFLVGFQGELDPAAQPALTSTVTDVRRVDGPDYSGGISYYGLEELEILLGSGHDRFNVRGTLPVTEIVAGAGDDLVYVSDSANLGAYETAAIAAAGDLAALHA